MMNPVALALLLLGASPSQDPVLHDARVVLQTSKGELILALYPQLAPRHVDHFLRLVRKGYYDGTRFRIVMRGFIIQHAGHADRLRPLTEEQARLSAERIPAEFGRRRHVRGTLSMARQPDDIDSATTVFTILLGDAPQMDGTYTIFGRVEKGWEILDALASVEVGPDNTPRHPLNVHRAFLVGDGPPAALVVLAGSAIVLGLAAFLLAGRFLPRAAGPVGLSFVIAGFFAGYVMAVPRILEAKEERATLALVVFLSLLALFKLMNKYESPKA